MQFLYYLLLFVLAISALIAILMATGVLHIEVYKSSNPDDLHEEIHELPEDKEDVKEE